MPAPTTADEFLELVRKSGVVDHAHLTTYLDRLHALGSPFPEPSKLAGLCVRDGLLTHFQAEQILQGKWRRFTIGRYTALERIGAGRHASVYLCGDIALRRLVAIKVLPTSMNSDPTSLNRFFRECQALASLDHPGIVRANEANQDDTLNFLSMEYVDGSSLDYFVEKCGPMDIARAANYIRQAAIGLQYLHERRFVHRDLKPADILVDRSGIVKIIDLGLVRFLAVGEETDLSKFDDGVLGTPDYIAPEQVSNPHTVDTRADIYSLGCSFYFCLTGRPPYPEGTDAQKVFWHQTRPAKPIRRLREMRPESPMRTQLADLIDSMMAKDPAKRPQTPQEVADALAPYTAEPIAPPPEEEMPQLCPAVRNLLRQ
jgi:serine/threonine protein kinase